MKKLFWVGLVSILLVTILWVGLAGAAPKYPSRNISWIVPYGPGGGFDLYSRALSAQLPKYLPKKVKVVVRNIRGGGGLTGVAQVYRAKPDGYTIGISYLPSPLVTQTIKGAKKVGYDFKRMTFLVAIATMDKGIYVGADTPYHSIGDLQKAEKVRFGATAIGAATWMDITLVGRLFGIKIALVPGYKRSPDIKLAIQRGDVAASIHDTPLVQSEIKEGTLRPILFLGSERDPLWPDVPTAKEVGVPEIIPLQRMTRLILAPPGLPEDVKDVLSDALWKALHDKDFLAWAKKAKYPVSPLTSEEVQKRMLGVSSNFEKYVDYIKGQLKQ